MKIVDGQGRLFGKINLIDLIFLILLIAVVVTGAKRLTKDPLPAELEGQAEITLHIQGIGEAGAAAIKKGQKIYHYDTNDFMGVVKDVKREPLTEFSKEDGQWIESAIPNAYLVILTIDGPVTIGDITTKTGSEDLLIGSEYRLKSNVSTFAGTCMDFSVRD